MADLAKWADYLLDAEGRREAVAPITDTEPLLTPEEGYEIQDRIVDAKAAAGERVVGAKLGLTSRAKQQTMGIDQPVYGTLTSAMALDIEQALDCGSVIHPRVEPEIVFLLGDDLGGPGVDAHDVLDATRWITAGLEVIDSRYAEFRFTHADVVADNTSASRFVLGGIRRRPEDIPDLGLLGCNVDTGGRTVATAAGAAILGHPASTVALLVNWLGRHGRSLHKGDVILSGGLTNAFPLRPGTYVSATFAHLGTVTLRGV